MLSIGLSVKKLNMTNLATESSIGVLLEIELLLFLFKEDCIINETIEEALFISALVSKGKVY